MVVTNPCASWVLCDVVLMLISIAYITFYAWVIESTYLDSLLRLSPKLSTPDSTAEDADKLMKNST